MLPFVYDKLPHQESIRILELQPELSENTLVCNLSTRLLSPIEEAESDSFDALSYTWGSPVRGRRILLNGCDFLITDSLATALLHLRRPEPVSLWVDAVCLNQDDLEEKSVHIQNMRDIYRRARRVEAWLGPEAAGSDLAMDFLAGYQGLACQFNATEDVSWVGPGSLIRSNSSHSRALDAAIYALLDRPWFVRVWVQQEATMNTNTNLRCGRKSVDIDIALQRVAEYLSRSHIASSHYTDMLRIRDIRALAFKILKNGITNYVPPPISSACLLDMVKSFQQCKATEPRDKIIAAAAFTESSGSGMVANAYNQSLEDFYQDFAIEHMRMRYIGLGILGYVGDFPDPSLPTWVADWRDEECTRIPFIKRIYTRRFSTYSGPRTYAAGISDPRASPPNVDFTVDAKLLRLSAAIIDSAADVISIPKYSQLTCSRQREWLEDVPCTSRYDAEEREVVIQRTLVADMCFGDNDLPLCRGGKLEWPGFDTLATSADDLAAASSADSAAQSFAYEMATTGRKLVVTRDGYYGLVPRTTQAGDSIAIFEAGQVLFVVRPTGNGQFVLIGECYIDGLMDGEALHGIERGGDSWQQLVLR